MRAADVASLRVTIANPTHQLWRADGMRRVTLSYRIRDERGEIVVLDGLRTQLPEDLPAGGSRTFEMLIATPDKPGRYVVELSPVQEAVAWFCDHDTQRRSISLEVVE